MTPREFVLRWHAAARLAAPRIIPDSWERQALKLIERGITGEDLDLVARWMLTQLGRSQAGERNSVAFNAASFAWRKMFGDYGSEAAGDEFACFAERLAAAEAARKPAARPVQTAGAAPVRRVSDEEFARLAAQARALGDGALRDIEGGPR